MTITFVSSLIDLDEARPVDKTTQRYFDLFELLNQTGIRIHLFLSPRYRGRVNLTNGVIEYLSLTDLEAYKNAPPGVPEYRNALHDTRNFLILMNGKVEMVKRAMDSGMHNATHYAWIDFGICHMFKTPQSTLQQLVQLAHTDLPDTCMLVPGCWDKQVILSHVNWRFCGSFFVGDVASIEAFYQLYRVEYPKMESLTWEVNVWAYLESLGWNPTWYKANHDDSILWVPYTSGVVRVPADVPLYWSGGYSACHPGSTIERYITTCLSAYTDRVSTIYTQSDGFIGNDEYTRMAATLGREDPANTPAAREFSRLESQARLGTKPIICTLCTRQFDRPNLLLTPLDDDTFNRGLAAVLAPFHFPAWEDRKPVAFWRGGSSGCDRPTIRMRVVDALQLNANADAMFTRGGWPANDAIIPDRQFALERVDLAKHFEYKYIFIIDGNCIASAHQWVFGSGSVPIMITHPDNQYWFKKYLIPMSNYVPIQYDLSDLEEKLEWLVTHDAEAKQIAENALHLSRTLFTPEGQQAYLDAEIGRILGNRSPQLERGYRIRCRTPSDIYEHLPTLREYAKKCASVVECGVFEITSSYAFASGLAGTPNNSLTMIDPLRSARMAAFLALCQRENVNAKFIQSSDLACEPMETDLLFIDSWHVYAQLKRELAHWHASVRKYIVMHDTTVDEWQGESVRGHADSERQSRETGFPVDEIRKGLWPAIAEFLRDHPEWTLEARYTNNNGLTILSRVSQ